MYCSSCFRCLELVTCLKMAVALSVPSLRWRFVELIMTAASTRLTLWVRQLPHQALSGFMLSFVDWWLSTHWLHTDSYSLTADNGLNPVWVQKQFVFDIHNPTFSFLRFTVYDEDMFSDPNFLAQATYPVRVLRTGDWWMLTLDQSWEH